MASRKSIRLTKIKSKNYNTLILSDVLCPICRSILIEPVSLPCSHDFCLFCLEGTMENANLVCPLCRLRIGSWLRKVKKDNILINGELWKAIKERFAQHVKNKLKGVDENIEEKQEIVVSYPGEIRKEYEIQMQKEEEEQNKIREAEFKASEELIKKIKEEENILKAVTEEKLKRDEELAKQLAEEFTSRHPSTSKTKISNKKFGPMDKFVKKENETNRLSPNSFINKEYTCRVLCLDSGKSSNVSNVKKYSPIIQKKIQQIQKIVDLERTSDGSDCIESEMRYFKPIDYRLNPPSQKKIPLKVIPMKLSRDVTAKILSPGGLINFSSNVLESAFARFSDVSQISESKLTSASSSIGEMYIKRTASSSKFEIPQKKLKKDTNLGCKKICKDSSSSSMDYNISTVAKNKLVGNAIEIPEEGVQSPPFYGFDRTKSERTVMKNGSNVHDKPQLNSLKANEEKVGRNLKRQQEQADLEYAKRLQAEINRSHYTRSFRNQGVSKRQKTLDELIKSPYKVK